MSLKPVRQGRSAAGLAVGGTLVVLAIVAVTKAFGPDTPIATARLLPRPTVQVASAARVVSSNAVQANVAPPPSMPASSAAVSSRLRAAMAVSTDWRQFALEAMTRPGEGGYFYARHVASICARGFNAFVQHVQDGGRRLVAAGSTVSSRQLQEIDRATSICSGFDPVEAAGLVDAIDRQSVDRQDPLMNGADAARTAIANGDRASLANAVQQVLGVRDPLLLSDNGLLAAVMASDPDASAVRGWAFDGKVYSVADPRGYADFKTALDLASCDAGSPCGMDMLVLGTCVGSPQCPDDAHDYARSRYVSSGRATDVQFSNVTSIETRIRQALKDGNVAAFVR